MPGAKSRTSTDVSNASVVPSRLGSADHMAVGTGARNAAGSSHCSLRFSYVKALSGEGSAHSGKSESTKKDTSDLESFVVVKEAWNGSAIKGQLLFEKWIASMYGSSRNSTKRSKKAW